ncbi:MAG: glycosyltransferase [Anaerolineales bacterium]|nr:glycosyltransferase [Anaerolineales bacterium]
MNRDSRNLLVCTVLPTYNERDNIGPLIEGVLDHAITRHLVIVVDDNSPDGTGAGVDEMAQKRNNGGELCVVHARRTEARGLTSAIQHGVDLAIYTFGADIVTWMDCDLSMPPADVPRLVQGIMGGADVSVGSRWVRGGADVAHGAMARTLSLVINGFAMALLGWGVRDYTSGFIAARAEVLQRLRLRGDYGEYCIDLLGRAHRQGYIVWETPYRCVPRTAGESKTGIDLWDYLNRGATMCVRCWR